MAPPAPPEDKPGKGNGVDKAARPAGRRRGPRRPIHCPRCGEPVVWEGNPWRPFCSERCQLIDRGAWADEAYRVPSEDSPGIESDEE